MKLFISAIALACAMPAAAQTAQAHQPQLAQTAPQQSGSHPNQGGHSGHQVPHGDKQREHKGQAAGACCPDQSRSDHTDCCDKTATHTGKPLQQQPNQPNAHQSH